MDNQLMCNSSRELRASLYSSQRIFPRLWFLPGLAFHALYVMTAYPGFSRALWDYMTALHSLNPELYRSTFGDRPLLSSEAINNVVQPLLSYFAELFQSVMSLEIAEQAAWFHQALQLPLILNYGQERRLFDNQSSYRDLFCLEVLVDADSAYYFYPESRAVNELVSQRFGQSQSPVPCNKCNGILESGPNCHSDCQVCSNCWLFALTQPNIVSCPFCCAKLADQDFRVLLLHFDVCRKCRGMTIQEKNSLDLMCNMCRVACASCQKYKVKVSPCHNNCSVCKDCWILQAEKPPEFSCPACNQQIPKRSIGKLVQTLKLCQKCNHAQKAPESCQLFCSNCYRSPKKEKPSSTPEPERRRHRCASVIF